MRSFGTTLIVEFATRRRIRCRVTTASSALSAKWQLTSSLLGYRAVSLLKRWALGTYQRLRRKHVDAYLDEFVFRYNRRFHRHVSFATVLGLAAHRKPETYRDIISHRAPHKAVFRQDPLPIDLTESKG